MDVTLLFVSSLPNFTLQLKAVKGICFQFNAYIFVSVDFLFCFFSSSLSASRSLLLSSSSSPLACLYEADQQDGAGIVHVDFSGEIKSHGAIGVLRIRTHKT